MISNSEKLSIRIVLTTVVCFLFLRIFSQDTVYFDKNWERVPLTGNVEYIRILQRSPDNPDKALEKIYYQNGQLKSLKLYSSYHEKTLQGEVKEWYGDGQVRKKIHYFDGKLDGEVITYYRNGQKKRHDYFHNGKFVDGKCWTPEGVEIEHTDFIVYPEFPGGIDQIAKYLKANIRYPKKLWKKGIQGKVIVNFNIDKNGNVKDIKIYKGVTKELDEEAIRVVKNMPKWRPGLIDGSPEVFNFYLPISFELDSGY